MSAVNHKAPLMREAMDKAIAVLGGGAATARALGISKQAVYRWRHVGRVPVDRVLALEEACENRVTRYELRPDIYPR